MGVPLLDGPPQRSSTRQSANSQVWVPTSHGVPPIGCAPMSGALLAGARLRQRLAAALLQVRKGVEGMVTLPQHALLGATLAAAATTACRSCLLEPAEPQLSCRVPPAVCLFIRPAVLCGACCHSSTAIAPYAVHHAL